MNGKKVRKKLENEGWICKRIRGSHRIYGKEGRKPVSIPVHGKKDLGIELPSIIERETGVNLDINIQDK